MSQHLTYALCFFYLHLLRTDVVPHRIWLTSNYWAELETKEARSFSWFLFCELAVDRWTWNILLHVTLGRGHFFLIRWLNRNDIIFNPVWLWIDAAALLDDNEEMLHTKGFVILFMKAVLENLNSIQQTCCVLCLGWALYRFL